MIPITHYPGSIRMSNRAFNSTIAKIAGCFKTYIIEDIVYKREIQIDIYDVEDAFYLYSPTIEFLFHASDLSEIEEVVNTLKFEWQTQDQKTNPNNNYLLN